MDLMSLLLFIERDTIQCSNKSCSILLSLSLSTFSEMEILFEKYLTTSDLSNLKVLNTNFFAVKENVVKYFRLATVVVGGAEGILRVEDEEGNPWQFGFSDFNRQVYLLTKGWSNFVKEKQLGVGDIVFLQRIFTDSTSLALEGAKLHSKAHPLINSRKLKLLSS